MRTRPAAAPRLVAALVAAALLLAACTLDNNPAETSAPAPDGTREGTGPVPTAVTLPPLPPLPPTTLPPAEAPPGAPGRIVEVLDGDSVVADLGGGVTEEVRLLGINAPEGDECLGDMARDALAGRLQGAEVTLVAGGDDDRDQFGRLLRYVYVGSANVNQTMLRNGLALAVSSGHDRQDEFVVEEERAFREMVGVWQPVPCSGPPPQSAIDVVEISADPPGDDSADLNGEWVAIRNNGERVAPMEGWVLRDESSVNRFVFPAGYELFPLNQVRVHTGCGDDDRENLYWCAEGPVWNNGGDTVLLLSDTFAVVARRRY